MDQTEFKQLVKRVLLEMQEEQKDRLKHKEGLYLLDEAAQTEQDFTCLTQEIQQKYDIHRLTSSENLVANELADFKRQDKLVVSHLSLSDFCKAALGISDNFVTACFNYCFAHDYPIYVIKDGLQVLPKHANQNYAALINSYERQLNSFGMKKISWGDLLEKNQSRNHVITAEQILTLANNTKLTVSDSDILTDLAREKIKEKQITVEYVK